MSSFRKPHQIFEEFLNIQPAKAQSRCICCEQLFAPNEGAWGEKGYFIPTETLCAPCIEIRNDAIALGTYVTKYPNYEN